ncbi:DUF3137 domain-containing protein [Ferruginibacter sp.]
MERAKTFDNFYSTYIEPQLEELNRQDKDADHWGTIMIFAILAAAASFILMFAVEASWNGGLITFLLGAFAVFSIYKYTQKDDNYTDNFKDNVIATIIKYIDPEFAYKPGNMVPSREYVSSGLFRKRYDYIDGDDFIEGTYKNVHFHCSELHTYKTGGRSSTSDITIFKGLFFAAAVNAGFRGGTYIWSKDDEQLASSIADERYRLLPLPQVSGVAIGDPLFDQYYSMCTTMPPDAKKIIDNGIPGKLLQFRQQIKRKVVFSVVAGKCYVAIPISEDLLEPNTPAGDREEVKKYFYTILLILNIINQLNLEGLQ